MDRELERRIMEAFQGADAACPQTSIRNWESPDFLFASESGILGIEVTQLFRAAPLGERPRQARERYADELVQRARLLHERRDGRAVDVAVLFIADVPSPELREQLANFVADLVGGLPALDRFSVLLECDDTNYSVWPVELASIRVFRHGHDTVPCWSVQDFDWGHSYTRAQIQEVVAKKELLISRYRRHCDVLWLLIATGLGGFSSRFERGNETLTLENSEFDRVILFDVGRSSTMLLWETGSSATR